MCVYIYIYIYILYLFLNSEVHFNPLNNKCHRAQLQKEKKREREEINKLEDQA